MNYVIVRNPKGVYKGVFEYLEYSELKNPNEKQKQLLPTICDGIDIFESEDIQNVKPKMKKGDYLYSIMTMGEKLYLESICTR